MKLELEVYTTLCEPKVFRINDIPASKKDFGEQLDVDDASAEEPYGCGDMKFIPIRARQSVLDKYKITAFEYNVVCEQLKKKLSFGCCGLCV